MPTTIAGAASLLDYVGEDFGTSAWMRMTQERIDLFADATNDHNWIHVDAEKAKEGPFGKTIAHGFCTLSLFVPLMHEVFAVEPVRLALNYGLNRVRFPSPVPVDSNIRLRLKLIGAEPLPGDGVQVELEGTMECDATEKPACVGVMVARYYDYGESA